MSVVPQCPPVPTPSSGASLLGSWLDAYSAAVDGFGRCWETALRRGPAAFDFPRWIDTATRRTAPSWTTPHEVVFEAPLARLRDFSVSRRRGVPPLVLRRVAPSGDLRFYEALVAMGGGVLEGRHMLAGFILIQPGAEISRQIDLLLRLDDEAHVGRYREFEDWFKHTQDVPGAFYLWI